MIEQFIPVAAICFWSLLMVNHLTLEVSDLSRTFSLLLLVFINDWPKGSQWVFSLQWRVWLLVPQPGLWWCQPWSSSLLPQLPGTPAITEQDVCLWAQPATEKLAVWVLSLKIALTQVWVFKRYTLLQPHLRQWSNANISQMGCRPICQLKIPRPPSGIQSQHACCGFMTPPD